MKDKKLKFVDLFAGIGGMRIAFKKAAEELDLENECVFSCEKNTAAQETYEANFKEKPTGDIKEVENLPDHNFLLAGFPCQPFSYAGKKRGFGDIRGTLFFDIMRLVDKSEPEVLILENVRGLLTNDDGRTFKTIKHEVESRGYNFNHFILNSSNYGLPQNRVRLFIIAIKGAEDTNFELVSDSGPVDSHSFNPTLFGDEPKVVGDILEEEPNPKYNCSEDFVEALKKVVDGNLQKLHGVRLIDYRGGNSIHSWELGIRGACSDEEIELMNQFILERRRNKFGTHRDGKLLTKEQIATFFPASNLTEILDSLVEKNYLQIVDRKFYKPVSGNFSFEVYKFLDPKKISVTLVKSDANRLGIYDGKRVRRITPREAARLQGFPEDFILHRDDNKAYRQLGNAVSINVVEAVAIDAIKNYLESYVEIKDLAEAS